MVTEGERQQKAKAHILHDKDATSLAFMSKREKYARN